MRRIEIERDPDNGPQPQYEVLVTDEASKEIEEAFLWHNQRSPAFAQRWYAGIYQGIATLAEAP